MFVVSTRALRSVGIELPSIVPVRRKRERKRRQRDAVRRQASAS
jgi:hypothetical protein